MVGVCAYAIMDGQLGSRPVEEAPVQIKPPHLTPDAANQNES
jgi:hypothetical protein